MITNPVETILNPRTYVYASNAEALVLQSSTEETRLTFLNKRVEEGTVDPRFVLSASNLDFSIIQSSNLIANFSYQEDRPEVFVPGRIQAQLFEIPRDRSGKKSVVLKDYNKYGSHQFAGFGYQDGQTQYQVPTDAGVHAFFAGADSISSMELMRIQTNQQGLPQVGIGTTSIESNVAFHVAGNTIVDGGLHVKGPLEFDKTGLVTLESNARISPNVMPDRILYLNSSNQVDTTYLPQNYQFQFLKSQKNVGIGTKIPMQRFHVQGTSAFTERVGIGTLYPSARIHAVEPFATISTMLLENTVGGNIFETRLDGSNVMTIVGSHAAVGIRTTSVKAENALEILGRCEIIGELSCSNMVIQGPVSLEKLHVEDANQVYMTQADLTQPDNTILNSMLCYQPFLFYEGISTPEIRGTGLDPYIHVRDTGLRVDGDFVLESQMYVISDARVKSDVKVIGNALGRIDRLHGYTYSLPSGKTQAGVMAQEVMDVLPEAVTMLPEDYYAVSYDSLVPLLVEAIRDLHAQVKQLRHRR